MTRTPPNGLGGQLASLLLVILGLGLLATWAYRLLDSRRATADAERRVESVLVVAATPTAPARETERSTRTPTPLFTATPTPPPGVALGQLTIARLGLTVPVLEGVDDVVLDAGAGRFPETAPLGGDGNTALAAHRDTHFRQLERVRPGDVIEVEVPGRTVPFEVTETRVVAPDAVEVLADAGDDRLTLVTCYPFDWVGPAPNRFVVVAHRLDESTPPAALPE